MGDFRSMKLNNFMSIYDLYFIINADHVICFLKELKGHIVQTKTSASVFTFHHVQLPFLPTFDGTICQTVYHHNKMIDNDLVFRKFSRIM